MNFSGSSMENSLSGVPNSKKLTSSIAASPAWTAGLSGATVHFLGTFVCELALNSQNLHHLQYMNALGPISQKPPQTFRAGKTILSSSVSENRRHLCA